MATSKYTRVDVEQPGDASLETVPLVRAASDLLNLASLKVSEADMKGLSTKHGWHKGRNIVQFYQNQNEVIDSLLETEGLHDGSFSPSASGEAEEEEARRLVNMSFASNIVLLFIRVFIAVFSGSLSIIVTTLDAVLDVISGFIIWFTMANSRRKDKYKYPVGQTRMEPLGIVVFSSIMGTAGFSVIMSGVEQLAEQKKTDLPHIPIIVGSSLLVIAMKAVMYAMCRSNKNGAVRAFALDHLNDIVVNTVGLGGALLGHFLLWWLDPVVAMVMSGWLIWAWGSKAYENIMQLVGVGASPAYLQKLTYIALQHDSEILQIDTVRAYSFGEYWLVEVDVVLPSDMPLQRAHDIGEGLQIKLERLPEVARAFVHLDYESTHAPEHKDI